MMRWREAILKDQNLNSTCIMSRTILLLSKIKPIKSSTTAISMNLLRTKSSSLPLKKIKFKRPNLNSNALPKPKPPTMPSCNSPIKKLYKTKNLNSRTRKSKNNNKNKNKTISKTTKLNSNPPVNPNPKTSSSNKPNKPTTCSFAGAATSTPDKKAPLPNNYKNSLRAKTRSISPSPPKCASKWIKLSNKSMKK